MTTDIRFQKNPLLVPFKIMNQQRKKERLIQEKLEREILHGLFFEWAEASWVLSSAHQEAFYVPLFSLGDMKGKWGYWSKEKREICLSRDLVFNHPWDAVREVLHHEMAHQLVDQVLGADGEPPHGPTFRRACHLLRANPKASGNYRPLDERIKHASLSREDKIIVRVKKLMALAQSKNKHEAEAAMAKAHEIIEKYNIDLLARDENRHYVSVFIGKPALRHFREKYQLASLLQEFYFVYCMWTASWVVDKDKMGRVLEITGTRENIKMAYYVHDFVNRYIDTQWRKYNKNKGLNRYRKTDFAVGIIEGFRSKLKTQMEKRAKDEYAVVKVDDPLLKKYAAYKYPNTTIETSRYSSRDEDVWRDGVDIGKDLIIFRGIHEKKKSRGTLIGTTTKNREGSRD